MAEERKPNEGRETVSRWESIPKEEFIKTLEFLQPGDEYPFDLVWITYIPQEGRPYPQLLRDTDSAVFVKNLRATFEKQVKISGSAYMIREHFVPILPDELVEPLEETLRPKELVHRAVLCLVLGERGDKEEDGRVGGAMKNREGNFPLESIDRIVHVLRRK